MSKFIQLYTAGTVKRWHAEQTIKEQDLAAHQWGVAMICRELMPSSRGLMVAALTHDLGESITGDIPYAGKSMYPGLRSISEEAEFEFAQTHDTFVELDHKEQRCLQWADMFEAYLFALREVGLGNQFMQPVVDNALRALDRMGHPNERALQLLRETHV